MRYGDAMVGAWAALGAVVALAHARRTGEGQFVDVSAVECMSSMIGDSLLAYDLTGDYPVADGNAHADMAPHGCYPCRDGEWLSIAVADERQWKALCRELGLPDLDARAASRGSEASRAEGGELDSLIAQATRERAAETLAMRLRAAGVAAARSLSTEDILRDELLWRRGTFRTVSDRSGGTRPVIAAPWRLSRNAARVAEGAPLLGEHNEYVFCKLLGLTPAELRQLVARGAAR